MRKRASYDHDATCDVPQLARLPRTNYARQHATRYACSSCPRQCRSLEALEAHWRSVDYHRSNNRREAHNG